MRPRPLWTLFFAGLSALAAASTKGAEEASAAGNPSPAPPPAQEVRDPEPLDPDALADALGLHAAKKHELAVGPLYAYHARAPATDEARPLVQLALAQSLAQLGLRHAAAVFLADLVRERTNPEALPPAIEQLQRLAQGPHDELLIERGVLSTLDVAFLPGEASSFVRHHQGLEALARGQDRWAEGFFERLAESSKEAQRARYATLLSSMRKRGAADAKAMAELRRLAAEPGLAAELRTEVLHALARLHFDQGEYKEALEAFSRIELPPLEPGRAALYLEEAWTRYHLGELNAAMGLLTTLDAPSFRGQFVPDKYLLKVFIYRDLCQYAAARRTARALPEQYAATLDGIRQRRPLVSDPRLVRAAVSGGPAKKAYLFFKAVEHERRLVDEHRDAVGEALARRLDEVYALAEPLAAKRYRAALELAVEDKANQLLTASEQARLLDYEIGLAMVKRRPAEPSSEGEGPTLDAAEPAQVRFRFGGEYWNDELRTYRFTLRDACGEAGAGP